MEILYGRDYPGPGVPLLVLHGLFGCGRNWEGLLRWLQPPRAVVLADLRNHGQSFHCGEVSFAAMAEDVERLRQKRGWERFHLLGHSLGGKVALRYALDYPQHLASLIMVDIAPRNYSLDFTPIIAAMRRWEVLPFPRRGVLVAGLQADLGGDAALAQFLVVSNYSQQGWLLNLSALAAGLPQLLSWPEEARQYGGPSLLLRGSRSNFVTDADLPLFPPLLRNFSAEVVREAGHNLHIDQPQAFADRLCAFLAQLEE